ncbi:MAG TPA: acetylxylan esterase [Thermoanaerobaculia bacterium]
MRRRHPKLILPAALLIAAGLLLAETRASTPALPPLTSEAHREALKLFEYDTKAPLDFQEASAEEREGVVIRDVSYASPKGGRVTAYLVTPKGKGPFPGVLFMHGMPGGRNRMLSRAVRYARAGAVGLAIDAPFSRRKTEGISLTFTEKDRDDQIQLIVDLRRGVDLLASRPEVDPARIAYVGASYGGAMGGLLAGVEKRVKAYVLEVGDGGLISHFSGEDDHGGPLQSRLPKERRERWLAAMEPIEPTRWIGRAAPSALLFQSGRQDDLVPPADARRYHEAGSQPKTVKWYDSGHSLPEQAIEDQLAWLRERIGLGS